MNRISTSVMRTWAQAGSRYLPFADAATADLPLSRLLRLSLFQVSVGMALVLLIGTLNRVMIVELGVPASLVGVMISLPLLFAPFRALIGFRSDTHRSVLGWRRVPFIYRGTMIQFGGLAIMPFAILVLAGAGQSSNAPAWIGDAAAALAFLLVGAGLHTIQTVGLALATDLAPVESQPKVVGLMYVMLLFGMIASALLFGVLLADFNNAKLVQVIQGAAVATIALNTYAVWKQEARRSSTLMPVATQTTSFAAAWERFAEGGQVVRRLVVVGLGTMAFSMEDVLLEPYGGQILHLSVGGTTKLTATLAIGGLFGFGLASRVLSRGYDPFRMARNGALVGLPAFSAVILAGSLGSPLLFALGTGLIGFGAGLFGHGTLTATMNLAPKNQTGLALGAWGAVQASAAGVAIALGGIIRDVVAANIAQTAQGAAMAYDSVYSLELALLLATLLTMVPLVRPAGGSVRADQLSPSTPRNPAARGRKGGTMSQTISKIFPSHETVYSVVAELKTYKFSDDSIQVVLTEPGSDVETITAQLKAAYVLASLAKVFAEHMPSGGGLVIVRPPFGRASTAIEILDSFQPVPSGIVEADSKPMAWDEAAPFSSALQWDTQIDDAAPFSKFLGLETLTEGKASLSEALGIPLLAGKASPLSSLVGLPTLLEKAAPLSSMLALPTLSHNPTPFSSLFKLKVLKGK
jgi:BCD family chlorophyll transporter-like MFS transporter